MPDPRRPGDAEAHAVWDEQAGGLLIASFATRIGAGWPSGLSTTEGEAATLWERYQRDIDAAFAAESWELLNKAFEDFRRGVTPVIRAWQRAHRAALAQGREATR